MDVARWEQIQELFHAALALSGEERRAFLDAECGTDAELRNAVEQMLQEDESGASLLDRGIPEIAYEMLVQEMEGVDSPPAVELGPYRLITAFSVLLFTESIRSSGFFLKKKPPSMRCRR
jgi:hypothetical protein